MYTIFKYLFVNRLLVMAVLALVSNSALAQSGTVLARGGGKTIIQRGTGSPSFVPVVTTIAFHAERQGPTVSGDFECLALFPTAPTGPGSGQFTVNVMYVTGVITSAQVAGDTATLRGTATVTGLGAGSGVPFTFVVRRGGPEATSTLTVSGLTFHEILLEGKFEVVGED